PQLKAIATMSVGYDHIDTKTCKRKKHSGKQYSRRFDRFCGRNDRYFVIGCWQATH
ncbi:hypothetical protein TNCV_3070511, partial [Trichonephila clavipes]